MNLDRLCKGMIDRGCVLESGRRTRDNRHSTVPSKVGMNP